MRRDRNHPSVVLWSLGNEIGEQHAPGGHEVLAMLVDIAHTEDPTRPVTTGNDHIYADDGATTVEFMELLDVVGYNYVDRWHERRELYATQDRHEHPDWKFIGTESSVVWGTRGEYMMPDDSMKVRPFYTATMVRPEQLWRFVSMNDWFVGDFMWTGIDYLGEARWPRKNSTSGVLDLVGFPDDGYFFYQSQWTDEPMIHLFPHWNWEGREGQFIPVLAYTNVDAVELYLNDRFIGEKRIEFPRQGTTGSWNGYAQPRVFPTTADLHVSWDVPYEPGVLRAVGKVNDEIVVTREVRTAGAPAALRLSVDRAEILSGIRDVAHVEVEVVDAAGVVVPASDHLVRFTVEGPAHLLAVGNGNPTDYSSYQGPERRAFHGLLMGMIQSTDEVGQVRVTARADGLEPASIDITVSPGEAPLRLD
jgi:beta-galactosidase